MELTFYRAQPSDVSAWGLLRYRVWSVTYRGIYPDDMIDGFDAEQHRQKDLPKLLNPDFYVYFLQVQKENKGYLVYQKRTDAVILHSLYLLPDAQRHGFGRQALEHVRRFCREQGSAFFRLQCNPWNSNAMAFYLAMGGHIIKEDIGNRKKIQDSVLFTFSV